jgi:hypothetical protein
MLDTLQKRAVKAAVASRIRTHQCEATSIGVDEKVDFTLAFYAAHEVPDPERLFREIYTCLHRGAKLLIVEPIGHVTARRFQQMLSLAQNVGMAVESGPHVRWSRAAVLTAQ